MALKENEKAAVALTGGVLLGFLLFRKSQGVTLHFETLPSSPMQIQAGVVRTSDAVEFLPLTNTPVGVNLPPGEYDVNMQAVGG